ncbi:MAG: phosphoribosylanthranilate isomerase [Clostridia bacterium]|nr:phosphoribosylanthranilate isomerase [Clostridia bacterium]
MLKVKICGMKDTSVMDAVNEALPDYVGVVLSPGYSRSVSLSAAREIRAAADGRIIMAGVFVGENPGFVLTCAERANLSCVQLHGKEDEEYVAAIKKRSTIKVVKTVTYADLAAGRFPRNADALLLDATPRKGYGGGRIPRADLSAFGLPVWLAGGLTPANVGRAIDRYRPAGVDVSSGVETDGRKDAKKIKMFVEEARRHG